MYPCFSFPFYPTGTKPRCISPPLHLFTSQRSAKHPFVPLSSLCCSVTWCDPQCILLLFFSRAAPDTHICMPTKLRHGFGEVGGWQRWSDAATPANNSSDLRVCVFNQSRSTAAKEAVVVKINSGYSEDLFRDCIMSVVHSRIRV